MVRERIEYLSHQDEELIAEKRRRIEETLWAIHEADIGEFFETYEIAKTDKKGNIETDENGKMVTIEKERPRRLSNIPAEMRRNIEKVVIDGKDRVVPQLYSKLAASQELRKMLNFGRSDDHNNVARLSDAELIQQLADQAKELGIEINLNYNFAQQSDE
jgi:tellurite resistance protein